MATILFWLGCVNCLILMITGFIVSGSQLWSPGLPTQSCTAVCGCCRTRWYMSVSITPWWRHQFETFAASLALCAETKSSAIHSGVVLAWIPKISVSMVCLKFIHLKSEPHLLGDNALMSAAIMGDMQDTCCGYHDHNLHKTIRLHF